MIKCGWVAIGEWGHTGWEKLWRAYDVNYSIVGFTDAAWGTSMAAWPDGPRYTCNEHRSGMWRWAGAINLPTYEALEAARRFQSLKDDYYAHAVGEWLYVWEKTAF